MKIVDYTDAALSARLRISEMLNATVKGFMEGSSDGIRDSVVFKFIHYFNMSVPHEDVVVIFERLPAAGGCKDERRCLSIHVNHAGEHYESIIRNIRYDDGYEL